MDESRLYSSGLPMLDDPFVDDSNPGLGLIGLESGRSSAPVLQLQPPSPRLPERAESSQPQQLLPSVFISTKQDAFMPFIDTTSFRDVQCNDSPVVPSPVPLWTPDSPSAVNPNLPPPPVYVPSLVSSRGRTRSNDSDWAAAAAAAAGVPPPPSTPFRAPSASPFSDAASLYSSDGGSPSSWSGSRPGSRRSLERNEKTFGFRMGGKPPKEGFRVFQPGSYVELESGVGSVVYGGKNLASEDLASRRRRRQKAKLGILAISVVAVFVILVCLAVGVGVGIIKTA